MKPTTGRKIGKPDRRAKKRGPSRRTNDRRLASLPHLPRYIADGFNDQVVCSCGFKSERFWDFAEAAFDDWRIHAESVGVVDPDAVLRKIGLIR